MVVNVNFYKLDVKVILTNMFISFSISKDKGWEWQVRQITMHMRLSFEKKIVKLIFSLETTSILLTHLFGKCHWLAACGVNIVE